MWFFPDELPGQWLCYVGGNVIELRPMQSVSSPTNRLVSGYVGGHAIQWRSMQSPTDSSQTNHTSGCKLVISCNLFCCNELPAPSQCSMLANPCDVSSPTNCPVSGYVMLAVM
jgi:hypothetical protein